MHVTPVDDTYANELGLVLTPIGYCNDYAYSTLSLGLQPNLEDTPLHNFLELSISKDLAFTTMFPIFHGLSIITTSRHESFDSWTKSTHPLAQKGGDDYESIW
jgi:hypothetical protein